MQDIVSFKIKGMQRDLSESAFNPEYSYENKNIRILSKASEGTFLSATNEQGTLPIEFLDKYNSIKEIEGTILGYTTIKDTLVIFSVSGRTSYIYKANLISPSKKFPEEKEQWRLHELYSGSLGFSKEYPIECISVYENENNQKVYWIDGKNQPRYINIVQQNPNYTDTSFDFVQPTLTQTDNVEVTVTKNYGKGNLPAGTVMFVVNAVNETDYEYTPFYISPIYYISEENKGNSAADSIKCSFDIKVKFENPTSVQKLKKVKVFAIHRSYVNATPNVTLLEYFPEGNATLISHTFTYDGVGEQNVSADYILYINNFIINPYTIANKDNTLFLGNYEIKSPIADSNIHTQLKNAFSNNFSFSPSNISIEEGELNKKTYYNYTNNLNYNSSEIKKFKKGEHYRFGLALVDRYGNSQNVIYLGNRECDAFRAEASMYINQDIVNSLIDKGFVEIKPLVEYPDITECKCLCQGIVSPTLYSNGQHYSSWIHRPIFSGDYNVSREKSNDYKDIALWKHNSTVSGYEYRNSEINSTQEFTIDQSVLTFHSPDIEFSNYLSSDDLKSAKFRIIGAISVDQTASFINLLCNESTDRIKWPAGSSWDTIVPIQGGQDSNFFKYANEKSYSPKSNYESYNTQLLISTFTDVKKDEYTRILSSYNIRSVGGDIESDNRYKIVAHIANHYPLYLWCPKEINSSYDINTKRISTLSISNNRYDLIEPLDYDCEVYATSKDSNLMSISDSNAVYNYNVNEQLTSVGVSVLNNTIEYQFDSESPRTMHGVSAYKYENNKHDDYFLSNLTFGVYELGTYDISKYRTRVGDNSSSDYVLRNLGIGSETFCLLDSSLQSRKDINLEYYSSPHLVIKNTSKDGKDVILPKYSSFNAVSNDYADSTDQARVEFISGNTPTTNIIYLGELYRNIELSDKDPFSIVWLPCGRSIKLEEDTQAKITWEEGDFYYQRYDNLKTYSTQLQSIGLTEILSFLCETRLNIDGRYDKHRGEHDNTLATPEGFNLLNLGYTQDNNFYTYSYIRKEYLNMKNLFNQVTWGKTKVFGNEEDDWLNVNLANALDLDGSKGKILKLCTYNNNLLAFQEQCISKILHNTKTMVQTSQGDDILLTQSKKVEGYDVISHLNSQNKHLICNTPTDIYFVDSGSLELYSLSNLEVPLSRIYNFSSWFKNNVTNNIWSPKAWDSNTNSFTLQFDEHSEDLYLISKDTCLGISEYLKSIQSFFSYENVPYIFNINNESYCFNTNKMYKMYSGEYNKFFDKDYSPYYIEYVVNDKPTVTKIFDTIEYYGDMFEYDTPSNTFKINHQNTFDSLDIKNEYQTGHLDMCTLLDGNYTYKNTRKKLRQWRAIIPRENGTRNRIVNPWAKIRISKNSPKNEKTILHNFNVKYSTV